MHFLNAKQSLLLIGLGIFDCFSGSAFAAENVELCSPLHVPEGPFFPSDQHIGNTFDLTNTDSANTAIGQVLYIYGVVKNASCKPIKNATVILWQHDTNGSYDHKFDEGRERKALDPNFRYYAYVKTDRDGRYLFKTILPSMNATHGVIRSAHVYFKLQHPDHEEVSSQLMFAGREHDDVRRWDAIYQNLPKAIKSRVISELVPASKVPLLKQYLREEPAADAFAAEFDQYLGAEKLDH